MDEVDRSVTHTETLDYTGTDLVSNALDDVIDLSNLLTRMEILPERKRKNNKRVRFTIPVNTDSSMCLHPVLIKRRKSARLAEKKRRLFYSKMCIAKNADSCEGDTNDDDKAGPSTEIGEILTDDDMCLSGGDESTINSLKRIKVDDDIQLPLHKDKNENCSTSAKGRINKRAQGAFCIVSKRNMKSKKSCFSSVSKQKESETANRTQRTSIKDTRKGISKANNLKYKIFRKSSEQVTKRRSTKRQSLKNVKTGKEIALKFKKLNLKMKRAADTLRKTKQMNQRALKKTLKKKLEISSKKKQALRHKLIANKKRSKMSKNKSQSKSNRKSNSRKICNDKKRIKLAALKGKNIQMRTKQKCKRYNRMKSRLQKEADKVRKEKQKRLQRRLSMMRNKASKKKKALQMKLAENRKAKKKISKQWNKSKPRKIRIAPRVCREDYELEEPMRINLLRYLTFKKACDDHYTCCRDVCWDDWDEWDCDDISEYYD